MMSVIVALALLMPLLATVLFAAPAMAPAPAAAQTPAAPEYEVKAEFLRRFSQFVTWPPEAFAGDDAPLAIGVLGQDPFGALLEAALAEAPGNGRRFVVLRFRTVAELKPCHILFIAASEEPRLGAVLRRLRGSPTLCVGETRRFAARGGMINFVLAQQRVRFEINAAAAEQAGLKLSSQLLKLGTVVR